MMFEFSFTGRRIDHPTLELVCDLIRHAGDDRWLSGSGSAALYAGQATLFLQKKEGLGVVVHYQGPEGEYSLVAIGPPAEGHVFYIGGNGYYIMPRHLVSVDEAVEAVTAFVELNPPGTRATSMKWEEIEQVLFPELGFPEHGGLPGWRPVDQA